MPQSVTFADGVPYGAAKAATAAGDWLPPGGRSLIRGCQWVCNASRASSRSTRHDDEGLERLLPEPAGVAECP